MPLINSPIPHGEQPFRHEGSNLRSVRDSDNPSRWWHKDKNSDFQIWALLRAVSSIRNELGRLKRRIVGGGTASAGSGLYMAGEYDPSLSYPDSTQGTQAMVIFTPDGQAAGTYVTARGVIVPAGVFPDTGAPNWIALPNAGPMQWT